MATGFGPPATPFSGPPMTLQELLQAGGASTLDPDSWGQAVSRTGLMGSPLITGMPGPQMGGGQPAIGPGGGGGGLARTLSQFGSQLRRPINNITFNVPQLALGPGGGGGGLTPLAQQLMSGGQGALGLGTAALGPGNPVGFNPSFGTGSASSPIPGMRALPPAGGTTIGTAGATAASAIDDVAAAGSGGALGAVKGAVNRIPFPKGGWGRTGVGIGAGIAGNVLGGALGGQESAAGRFASGAGMGAGLGAFFGPWGALGGGLIGGTASALFGGGDEGGSSIDNLNKVLDDAPFSDEQKAKYRLMFEVLKETTGDDQAALSQVGQAILAGLTETQTQEDAQARMLATQALTAEFFQPFTQQLLDSAQQRAAIGEELASSLPPAYQGIARMQNAASLDNATRTANAYAAQAQLLPALSAIEYQQALAGQAAQQQAMGGGAGATSLADLAGQLATQG